MFPLLAFIHVNVFADALGSVVAVLCALLFVSLFSNATDKIELKIIHSLSRAMNHRRWFTFWMIGFPIWAIVRSIVMRSVDWDTIITTGLWSWWPFAVENIVKVAQGKSLETITDLVVEVKKQNDQSEQRDLASAKREEALLAVSHALLDAISNPEGGEVAQHG